MASQADSHASPGLRWSPLFPVGASGATEPGIARTVVRPADTEVEAVDTGFRIPLLTRFDAEDSFAVEIDDGFLHREEPVSSGLIGKTARPKPKADTLRPIPRMPVDHPDLRVTSSRNDSPPATQGFAYPSRRRARRKSMLQRFFACPISKKQYLTPPGFHVPTSQRHGPSGGMRHISSAS